MSTAPDIVDQLKWCGDMISLQAAATIAELREERAAVYLLGEAPAEQTSQIPLPLFVATRFVPVGKHNEIVDMLRRQKQEFVNAALAAPAGKGE